MALDLRKSKDKVGKVMGVCACVQRFSMKQKLDNL